jgi:C4-dicarboxylate-binding protein DctP
VRSYDVFELPFVFDSFEDLRKVADGPIGRGLLQQLESKGIIGLGYWDNGFKGLSANRPLRVPDDARGLKFRIASSKVIDGQMRLLGALPQVLAFSEVYQALQTGVVDGAENTPSNFYTQKLYEVQKYFTLTEQSVTEYVVVVGKTFWEGLPPDIRAQLDSAMRDATKYVNEIAKQENDEALEAIRKSGRTQIITLTADEKRAWKKALIKLHHEYEDKIGKALIESIYKETGFDPKKL